MPSGTVLTAIQRGQIDVLVAQGLSISNIARAISKSRKVVSNYLKNPGTYGQNHKGGRPQALSAYDKRQLLRSASNQMTSIRKLKVDLDLQASKSAIGRFMKSCEHLTKVKMQHKPRLTDDHKEARRAWAVRMIQERQNWYHLLFSDEKRFNLDGPDGYRYYWHDLRKDYRYFSKRVQGGGGVMIWACFGAGGYRMAIVNGKLNSEAYTDMLEIHMLPYGEDLGSPEWVFQQDNAPSHYAEATWHWFGENNVKVLDWPAVSPDMNPIENVWGMLIRIVYEGGRQFDSRNQLIAAIESAWARLQQTDLIKLLDTMPQRLVDLIEVRGGHTKW